MLSPHAAQVPSIPPVQAGPGPESVEGAKISNSVYTNDNNQNVIHYNCYDECMHNAVVGFCLE